MTKGIEDTLGLRSMEDALKDFKGFDETEEAEETAAPEEEDDYDPYTLPAEFDRKLMTKVDHSTQQAIGEKMLAGTETDSRLDDIYETLMAHGETMARLALELDPGKAPRAFEVMNGIIKNAMDAVTSKRDHELKTMRLMLEQQKFEHEKNSAGGVPVSGETNATVSVMTTADLVRQFRNEMEAAPSASVSSAPKTDDK